MGSKPIRSNVTIPTSFSHIFFSQMMSCAVVIMTSFIIPSPSILNNWRRGGMTALAMGSWQIPLITVCSVAVHTPKSWKVKKSDYWQAGKNNKPWQKKAYRFRLKAVILFWTLKTVIHMGAPEATTLESATCIIKAFNGRIRMWLNKLLH